jgi:adenine phosphoribosyltransferase
MKGRGPQAISDPEEQFRGRLKAAFSWRADRPDERWMADPTGWWANPELLAGMGPALAGLTSGPSPTVVLGPQSRGMLLGGLVAAHLGIGLVELRKDPGPAGDSDRWLMAHTPPDYRDRTLQVGVRHDLLIVQRVLLVDDWIATGGQALAAADLVERAGAVWCGCVVVCDALSDARLRRELKVSSLVRVRDL